MYQFETKCIQSGYTPKNGEPRTLPIYAGAVGIILSAVLAVILASAGVVGENSSYKLHDGPIMWSDSYYRLSASGIFNPKALDITDTAEVYSYINTKTANIVKKYPLTGTGPEQLVYPQLYSSVNIYENVGTFDKNYNEYLYTAATRGVPSLIALIAVLVPLAVISAKNFKKNRKSMTAASFFFLLVCGIILFFVGNSNIAFSPIFWAAAGASCASLTADKGSTGKAVKNSAK